MKIEDVAIAAPTIPYFGINRMLSSIFPMAIIDVFNRINFVLLITNKTDWMLLARNPMKYPVESISKEVDAIVYSCPNKIPNIFSENK